MTQRLLATAMTPLLIIQCLLTPLSVWADSLPVQPESTDYSVSAADSSEDEDIVLNDEQQGVEVEQPAVSDNDSPSSVSSESASNATDSPKPENDVSAVFGSVFIPDSCTGYWLASSRFKWNDGWHNRSC